MHLRENQDSSTHGLYSQLPHYALPVLSYDSEERVLDFTHQSSERL